LRSVEVDKIELNNHLSLTNGFINFSDEAVTTFQTPEVNEQLTEFVMNAYGIGNALASYFDALTQYDEVNPQFFEEIDYFAEPSCISQKL